MKHLKKGRKFSREKKQREALMKVMLGNLFVKSRILTTLAKAKELKKTAEIIIGQIKKPSSVRQARMRLPQNIRQKRIEEIAAKTSSRNSGYMRIIKRGRRRSDSAEMAIIEIIEDKKKEEPAK